MRKLYTMKNLVKGLMLSAVMTLGVATASAQETNGGADDTKYEPVAANKFWMGEAAAAGDFYLYNVGADIFATNDKATEKSIDNAVVWTAKVSNGAYSFTGKNGYKIQMWSVLGISWNTKVTQNATATNFKLATGTTTDKGNVYKFSYKAAAITQYFNVDGSSYKAGNDKSTNSDWLLISETQKNAYTEYVSLFNEATSYLDPNSKLFKSDNVEKRNAIVKQINDALKSYNYNTYKKENGGNKLDDAIKAAEAFINATTGINEIGSTTDAKVSEIYGVNGARKSQLTKGLNIVKMSDGTVKKVLVK